MKTQLKARIVCSVYVSPYGITTDLFTAHYGTQSQTFCTKQEASAYLVRLHVGWRRARLKGVK